MIYTVTLNPALDKTVIIPSLKLDAVNRIQEMRTDPGGKGINVSKVLSKLGTKSIAAGILGGDTGRAIKSAVEKLGIETLFKFTQGETRTNLKIIDPEKHMNTDINEPGVIVSQEILDELLDTISGKISSEDIVVISGSMPKGAPEDTYYKWIERFRKAGAKVFLDADGALFKTGIKASPYLIKPNDHELSQYAGRTLKTPEELSEVAEQMMSEYGIEKIVVSMGAQGALYLTKDGMIYAQGLKVPVGSTVGAGDSVVAALAYAEEKKMTLEETVRLSTATGAANVMCSGTQAAEYAQIKPLIEKVKFSRME